MNWLSEILESDARFLAELSTNEELRASLLNLAWHATRMIEPIPAPTARDEVLRCATEVARELSRRNVEEIPDEVECAPRARARRLLNETEPY